jgi:hypothetical protein
MTTMSNEQEAAEVLADGLAALRDALDAEGMGYAAARCAEEFTRALDAARFEDR